LSDNDQTNNRFEMLPKVITKKNIDTLKKNKPVSKEHMITSENKMKEWVQEFVDQIESID